MSKFNLSKEMKKFDEMLNNMSGDEVMEMLIQSGYGRIKSPLESGYIPICEYEVRYNDLNKEELLSVLCNLSRELGYVEGLLKARFDYGE